MVLTKRGLSLLVVAGTLYGLAWLTHIGWFYVVVSPILAALLVNLLFPPLTIRGLVAERRIEGNRDGSHLEIFEDDTVAVAIRLSSRALLPKIVVTLHDDCPLGAPGEEPQGFLIGALRPRGSAVVSYKVRSYRRGLYSFPLLRVGTAAPFGLFRSTRTITAPLEATVYPKVLPVEASPYQGALQGDSPSLRVPGPTGEVRGSREFQHSDHLRNIHWRNSARRGKLMVREFDQPPRGELRIAFNPGVDLGKGRDTTLEYAIKIAASLARRSFREGRPFRIWPGWTKANLTTWHGVLEHLARIRAEPASAVAELISCKGQPGISVIVVSAADEDSIRLLRGLQSPDCVTVVMMEGFDSKEDAAARRKLAKLGLRVVPCHLNELRRALAALAEVFEAPIAVQNSGRGPRWDGIFWEPGTAKLQDRV